MESEYMLQFSQLQTIQEKLDLFREFMFDTEKEWSEKNVFYSMELNNKIHSDQIDNKKNVQREIKKGPPAIAPHKKSFSSSLSVSSAPLFDEKYKIFLLWYIHHHGWDEFHIRHQQNEIPKICAKEKDKWVSHFSPKIVKNISPKMTQTRIQEIISDMVTCGNITPFQTIPFFVLFYKINVMVVSSENTNLYYSYKYIGEMGNDIKNNEEDEDIKPTVDLLGTPTTTKQPPTLLLKECRMKGGRNFSLSVEYFMKERMAKHSEQEGQEIARKERVEIERLEREGYCGVESGRILKSVASYTKPELEKIWGSLFGSSSETIPLKKQEIWERIMNICVKEEVTV